MLRFLPAALLLLLLLAGAAAADEGPAPPTRLSVEDYPYDWGGGQILVKWSPSPDEGQADFQGYRLERAERTEGPWSLLRETSKGTHTFLDPVENGKELFYRIASVSAAGTGAFLDSSGGATAVPNRFISGRFNSLIFVFLFTALILGWIWTAGRKVPGEFVLGFFLFALLFAIVILAAGEDQAVLKALAVLALPVLAVLIPVLKSKGDIYVRPIPAIQAVEEAIGRSTEMGKPILFVPGISTIEDVATLAALNILGPVAEKSAQYDSKLIVPNYDPIVYTVTQEVVKEAYLKAGRPDAYSDDNVFYLSARQFAYAAAVNGMMVREKPATNFFLGMFYAESLLLAETGNMTGAIQIAGTDAVTQLPFFIVACDYTLIGEELYAAGAYMGGDPKLTGGLKGQDWNKALAIAAIVLLSLGFLVYGAIQSPERWAPWVKDLPSKLFEVSGQ